MMIDSGSDSFFSRSTMLVSLLIAAVVGGIFTPAYQSTIFVGVAIIVVILVFYDMFNQVNENSERIEELTKELNTTKKLLDIETEVSEQRGKLNLLIQKHEK